MKLKIIIYVLCFGILISSVNITYAENITQTFYGIDNAQEMLNNIDFNDINNSWAKNSIYEMAALSAIKGYGDKQYKPQNNVTKGEALALIYQALGQEAAAQKAAETNQSTKLFPISNIKNIWAEGYLILAKNDGLITQAQYDQGVNPEGYTFFNENGFFINDPVNRQDMATWVAKAFKIAPVYNQTNVFNNYKDWSKINPTNLPYVEALLENKIMNGDNGYFYPNNVLKRDEVAQILQNLETQILNINKLNKKYGYIENIDNNIQKQPSKDITQKTILFRGEDGILNSIVLQNEKNSLDNKSSEIGNHNAIQSETEVIVNKDGKPGSSDLLGENDKIAIIYDANNKIKYIDAKSNNNPITKYFGTVTGIDLKNNTITFVDNNSNTHIFGLSNGIIATIDNEGKSLTDISPDSKGYITVRNNLVNRIDISTQNASTEIKNNNKDIKGIVKEVNPNLNYISLYGPLGQKDESYIRTINFSPNVVVTKDDKPATISEIENGDTAYLKVDDNGIIELINIEKNYSDKYGTIQNIGKDFAIIMFDDGTTQYFTLDSDTLIYKNGDTASLSDIYAGDKVKVTLNSGDQYASVKDIDIEPEQYLVKNIYKGKVYSIDNNQIVLYDLSTLSKDKWIPDTQKGFAKIPLDDSIKIYINNKEASLKDAQTALVNNDIYAATYDDYQNNEKVLKIDFEDGAEKLYNDKVYSQSKINKSLGLFTAFDSIYYDNGTIVTRYGRLVNGNNIQTNDPVYIVGLRNPQDKAVTASVIQVADKPSTSGIDIYRGKISSIDEGNSFTVESFSKLQGFKWEFTNTPKTFEIDNNTEILSTEGVVNNRDFKDYSNTSYKDKIVYIASVGSKAQVVSDGQYGVYNLKGEINSISSKGLDIVNASVFDPNTGKWTSADEAKVNILGNTVIVKNNQVVEAGDLQIGDKIRAIKKDNATQGDGYIILVEE